MIRRAHPAALLVRVGGGFPPGLQASLRGMEEHVRRVPAVDRATLAAIYRRADVVLLTSEREGFGLPLLEAIACGAPVVASDLPVLREVGGAGASYAAAGDAEAFARAAEEILARGRSGAGPERERAAATSLGAYAAGLAGVYEQVLREAR
jgi:glycosyltransferase involved in cell wall biosynthesis